MLKPLTDKYFASDDEFDMQSIYNEVCQLEKSRIGKLQENICELYELAENSYEDYPEENKEFLKQFAFICNLSFDVYVKKQIIEKMIDELPHPDNKKKKEKKEK